MKQGQNEKITKKWTVKQMSLFKQALNLTDQIQRSVEQHHSSVNLAVSAMYGFITIYER